MAATKTKKLSDKLEEIKKMQNNWMQQRAAAEEKQAISSGKKSQKPKTGVKSSEKMRKEGTQDTISWVVGGSQTKKVQPKSLRARSASPARNSSGRTLNMSKGQRPARPSSGRLTSRSNPSSSRTSKSSQPSSRLSQRNGDETSVHSSNKSDEYQNNGKVPLNSSCSESDLLQAISQETIGDSLNESSSMHVHPNIDSGGGHAGLKDLQQHESLLNNHRMTRGKQNIPSSANLHLTADTDQMNSVQISHVCSRCGQHMIPPDHIPTLLIPCGHTFCEPCAEDRIKCPFCRTKVTSTAVNDSLQNIILGSTNRLNSDSEKNGMSNIFSSSSINSTIPKKEPLERIYRPSDYCDKEEDRRTKTTNEDKYSSSFISNNVEDFHSTFAQPKRELDLAEQFERYSEEFESLCIRCEAYECEEGEILKRIEKKSQEIDQQKKQISNITREQQKIEKEISSLQEKLSILSSHRNEFKRQCDVLEEVKKEDVEKLDSIRNTVKGLQKQREKIRFLARNMGMALD
ncbi:hypothetical protein HOLleu_35484 [Holothuria leucospilota]|uniref:RING-type domain-containing protein n=1 Tax=Holothuria leucospilota TaxID=206669 RepID=A0A9Q1BG57_HOLLE|nr:hypothetical protein HOLleu_35484 [Holothuria leucospilota]